MISVLLLAVALALDSAAAAAALGGARASRRTILEAAFLFGAFQAGMAAAGAWGGAWLATIADSWDHWIAFALLSVVGGRMLIGTGSDPGEPKPKRVQLLALALATSIDALASGVTLPQLGPPVPVAVAIIGGVAFLLSLAAGIAGRTAGAQLGTSVERLGGLVLIAIGLSIVMGPLFR